MSRYGSWALVTGASDGIGQAFARVLAGDGANVVLVARREAALQELAAELRASYGVETRVVAADLAEPASAARIERETADLDIGIVVAAAGFGTSGDLIDGDLDDELRMIDVNCRAVAALAHRFGKRLAARGRGALVLLSSVVAFQGVPRAANYAATKAYVQSLAEGLRVELRPHGVDVIASAPGTVRSGFAARANMTMSAAATPEVVARGTLVALGRWGTVRPGFLAKLLGWSLAWTPRAGRVAIMQAVMGGMTQHRLPRAPSERSA